MIHQSQLFNSGQEMQFDQHVKTENGVCAYICSLSASAEFMFVALALCDYKNVLILSMWTSVFSSFIPIYIGL